MVCASDVRCWNDLGPGGGASLQAHLGSACIAIARKGVDALGMTSLTARFGARSLVALYRNAE
ncbi:hypothetical protein ACFOHT_25585 [Massilia oculi]|uniref:Uncharacterized protein n=1 Tax=Massilia oculi TaxID=945844 RepID=A0A2S2DNL5_9BURK|nr:hypothetical protein [Massilia oculi]AWL06970.1 hypothetical protein DIR46_22760 [Massilia oculi]